MGCITHRTNRLRRALRRHTALRITVRHPTNHHLPTTALRRLAALPTTDLLSKVHLRRDLTVVLLVAGLVITALPTATAKCLPLSLTRVYVVASSGWKRGVFVILFSCFLGNVVNNTLRAQGSGLSDLVTRGGILET